MKRKVAIFLSAVLAASCLPMSAYAANFKDINDVPWAGAAAVINSVADLGLLNGYEDGTFRARNNVTYCEAMQMVYSVLVKTGAVEPIDAADAYSYFSVLDTYRVPKWAQLATAYGLHNNIVDMQMVASKFSGGNQAATREDVAILFGNAMGKVFGKERDTSGAQSFADYWSISVNAMEQVSLLKQMGILNGDEYNRFNPKKNINRAEMAVMLNQTYNVVNGGMKDSGEIVELMRNGDNYYIKIKLANGRTEGFNMTEGQIPVYVGKTSEKIPMSRLSEGDDVEFQFSGTELVSLRVMKQISDQEKYDITGYITAMKDNTITLENENTGETKKYALGAKCDCYVDGKQVLRRELEDILDERYDEHAYAGLIIDTELEKKGSSKEEVVTVEAIYITFSEEYVVTGKVESCSSSRVSYKASGTNTEKSVAFAEDCEFYIGEEKASVSDMQDMVDEGTTYVKLTIDKHGDAVKVIFAEDTFESGSSKPETTTYELLGLNKTRMIVKAGAEKTTHTFGSSNPVDNISFYTWDDDEKEFDEVKFSKAEEYYDSDDADDVYCRIAFNKGGKISSVELSYKKSAWRESGDQTERKGTVASLKDGVLKFKTSSVAYQMLSKYNVDYNVDRDDDYVTGPDANGTTVRNPLIVSSSVTSSLTVFERMANDDDVELYAEITADGDNNVVKVDSRLTSAKGTLVEYDREDKEITLETSKGNKLKLKAVNKPKLTDEDEDTFTLDHVASTNYVGAKLELGFNSSGEVNQITVTEESGKGMKRVKGIATAAEDGLKVKGVSGTYQWPGRNAVNITNYSGTAKSLDAIKTLIEDDAVEVYVEAAIDDAGKVDSIKLYVREAAGELTSCDENYVRIKTKDGNKFSFDLPSKLKTCDVKDLTQKDLEDGDADDQGYDVTLGFDEDGRLESIEEA